jgi:fumarate hydratase subunit alpha
MKEIDCSLITDVVKKLCIDSNTILKNDVLDAFKSALKIEVSPIGKDVLQKLILNSTIAKKEGLPMCQDTGMTVVFVELGQDVKIIGGDMNQAIHLGVAKGYEEGFLRKSVVRDPLMRENTGDNTPAVIHYEIVPGDSLNITVAPKGFGSENMSALKMLTPSDGIEGVSDFIIETVEKAGPNACPPIIVGVGLGGTMEKCAILSKKALLRTLGKNSTIPHIASLEKELLGKMNHLGIGPGGFGGRVTALAVHIETFPTHIAGLPVAVNICCHASRHAKHSF